MNIELPAEVVQQLTTFEVALDGLEAKLQPLMDDGAELLDQLEPLERAEAQLAAAAAAVRLLQLYLKARGANPKGDAHASVGKEAERYKQYSRKVRKLAAEAELARSRKSLEVDVAAVNRFIAHAVPLLGPGQRAALREAGAAAAGKRPAQTPGQGRSGGKQARRGSGGGRDAALAFLDETLADIQREGRAALAPAAGAGAGPVGSSEERAGG